MAKNVKTMDVAADVTTTTTTPIVAEAFGFTFDISNASRDALAYIVGFGFRQALSDATAGLPKAIGAAWEHRNAQGDAAKAYEGFCETAGLDPDHARGMALGAFTAAVCDGARRVRYERIMSGTIGTRGPGKPRVDSSEKLAMAIAKEWLVAAAKAKGKALPTGDNLVHMIQEYRNKYAEQIAAEITRRTASTVPDDFEF